MRVARGSAARLAAAFGCGVLVSMICPPEWVLVVTVIVLILLAICGSNYIRG